MQSFRILYFRQNVIEHSEELELRDVLEAIDQAARKPSDMHAEIWSSAGRVGVVPPAPSAA